MVRHFDERIHERKQMFSGQGEAQFHRILNGPEEMYGKGRVFSHVVLEKGAEIGWHVAGFTWSPIKGPKGNIEFLADIRPGEGAMPTDEDIASLVQEAHDTLNK